MRISFLIAATLLSQSCFAESQARTDRGFSCTDSCTAKGSKAFTPNKVNVNSYVDVCDTGSIVPGSIATCEAKCLEKGSLSTRLFNRNRASDVQNHVKTLKDACTKFQALQNSSARTQQQAKPQQPTSRPTQNTQVTQPQPSFSKEDCSQYPSMRRDYDDLLATYNEMRKLGATDASLEGQLKGLKTTLESMARECGQPRAPRTFGPQY